MAAKRKRYTAACKRDAVSLITDHGDGSVQRPAMWAGMPRGCGSGNGPWRKTAHMPVPALGVCVRRRKPGIVCDKQTHGGGWSGRACRRRPCVSPTRRVAGHVYRAGAHDLARVSVLRGDAGAPQGGYAGERRQAHRTLDGGKLARLARGKALARDTRQSDGRRRLATPRQAEGFFVGRSPARRLRHEAGVAVRRPRARGPVTTDSRQGDGVADKVLARQCAVAKPEHAWAGAITDIWTAEGGFYLSGRWDVYSRKGMGIEGAVVQHA